MTELHGKEDGNNGRLCKVHGAHGILYDCPEYNNETREKIRQRQGVLSGNLRSRAWRDKQMENGVPREAIDIFRAFAGIEPGEWDD